MKKGPDAGGAPLCHQEIAFGSYHCGPQKTKSAPQVRERVPVGFLCIVCLSKSRAQSQNLQGEDA